jgi:predicted nucleic acid-binding Zn ribbon protein
MTGGDGRRKRTRGETSGSEGAGPGKLGPVLQALFRDLGIEEQVQRQEALHRWESRVGERIAAVTRAREMSGATLFVEVRSSAWLNELNFMRAELLSRLNAGAEGSRVERIVFVLAEPRV